MTAAILHRPQALPTAIRPAAISPSARPKPPRSAPRARFRPTRAARTSSFRRRPRHARRSCATRADTGRARRAAAEGQNTNPRAPTPGCSGRRRSVSRVLSRVRVTPGAEAIIPLGRQLPAASSGLPAGSSEQLSNACLRGLAPDGVCRAARVAADAVGSYPAISPLPSARRMARDGGFFSVALSSAFPPPGVIRHRALWSSDFPPVAPHYMARPAITRAASTGRMCLVGGRGAS